MDLEAKFEREKAEVITLTKLESEQRIKQVELDKEREVQRAKTVAENTLNDERKKLLKENYDTLQTSLTKLHTEGNAQTKFVQEMALKLVDKKASFDEARLRVNFNQPEAKSLPAAMEDVVDKVVDAVEDAK